MKNRKQKTGVIIPAIPKKEEIVKIRTCDQCERDLERITTYSAYTRIDSILPCISVKILFEEYISDAGEYASNFEFCSLKCLADWSSNQTITYVKTVARF